MKVVINAISAKMGGAVAYIRNFLPTLAMLDRENEYIVLLQEFLAEDYAQTAPNIHTQTAPGADGGGLGRVKFDQVGLRKLLKRERADVIFSTANFGVLAPPVPQVISVRNPVYFCRGYYRHVRETEGRLAALKVMLRRRMVQLSARSSSIVVTPTAAMRDMMLEWGGISEDKCTVIHHGFDRERFLSMECPLREELEDKLARRDGEKLLLYPAHYGKHKNFDTLVEGLAWLRKRGARVKLVLTTNIDPDADAYQRRTARLVATLSVGDDIVMLGSVPYACMPHIYGAVDVVVWPSFAESFGHPLLEAMAALRPIVASDIAVNREMAADAAVYFDAFDAADLADKVEATLSRDTTALVARGLERTRDFSWQRHVTQFTGLFERLAGEGDGKNA